MSDELKIGEGCVETCVCRIPRSSAAARPYLPPECCWFDDPCLTCCLERGPSLEGEVSLRCFLSLTIYRPLTPSLLPLITPVLLVSLIRILKSDVRYRFVINIQGTLVQ